jgi:beta-carotene ketolase (CrtO type)
MDQRDVIVVGGGHQGLTVAAFLARAGKTVTVLEAAPIVGGFATTEEMFEKAPGFRSTPNAIDLFAGMIPPSVFHDLELHRYGFQTYVCDPYCTYLGPNGESIAQWRDIDRTAREIARYSRRDAASYQKFATILGEAWNAFLPYLVGHPKHVAPKTIGQIAWRALRARKSLAPAVRILLSSPEAVLEEWFERDEVKIILGTWAVATGQVPLDTPGYAAGMAMATLSHRWGCYRAVGGMGAVTGALARCLEAHGGEIRVNTPVESVLTDGPSAYGVRTVSGEELRAGQVIGAVDPQNLFSKLVDPSLIPEKTEAELRAMTVCGKNITYFTGHAALSERPTLPRHGREDELLRAGYTMLVPSYDSLKIAIADSMAGRLSEHPPIWLSFASVLDRTLVPEGSSGESMYFMTPACPFDLEDGEDWSTAKERNFARCFDIVDSYAVGVKEHAIDTAAVSPYEMARWTTKGHACHIDMPLTQMGPWRPTPSLSGYKTPIEGLWHVSAGAHPMPSVNGWAGRAAAAAILKEPARATPYVSRPASEKPPLVSV